MFCGVLDGILDLKKDRRPKVWTAVNDNTMKLLPRL